MVCLYIGGRSGKDPTCQCKRHKRFRFTPWGGGRGGDPLEEGIATPVCLPGQRSLTGCSPGG